MTVLVFTDKLAFQFKMQTKMLERQAITHDKQEKGERDKVKKALMKGNLEAAKIHAENAIRHHSESLNCKRMAARVDGVQARVANSAAQRQVTLSRRSRLAPNTCTSLDGRKSQTNGFADVESDCEHAAHRDLEINGQLREELRRPGSENESDGRRHAKRHQCTATGRSSRQFDARNG